MTKFEETLKKVQDELIALGKQEGISTDTLDKITALNSKVNELGTQHQDLVEKHSNLKDLYIKNVSNFGTSKLPEDETGGKTPRTMEEIAKDILANEKK